VKGRLSGLTSFLAAAYVCCGWAASADAGGHAPAAAVRAKETDPAELLRRYVKRFNASYPETDIQAIPNAQALDFLRANVPRFECPDKQLEEIYYFRWWTYRKHIKRTPDGFVVTEFLPKVGWAGKHNTINCPVGHHLYEGRWIRDPKYLDDYIRFYFGKGGAPGGVSKHYSNWITDGIYARYLVNADRRFVVELLDDLVANHEAWGRDGKPGKRWQAGRLLENGLYWQIDSWSGGEYSIGGTGIRPMLNSYMYGSAVAIARIAELAGRRKLARRFRAEADGLRSRVQERLWDPNAMFFKVRRHAKARSNYNNNAAEQCKPGQLVTVREIFGYVPWYFNLPQDGRGYAEAWRQLTDPQGFLAPYGPTVAERRHPNFKINRRGCRWCGASWPFATSQTLTALANLLNNYDQSVIGKKAYFDTLKAYARSHYFRKGDGAAVPWVDESLNPDTGKWITKGAFPDTRGRYYNHSTFCDLVIAGLVGLRPRSDDLVEVNPLVPRNTWDWFRLDNVSYRGHTLTILWDRTGKRYGTGKGLQVLAAGRVIARGDTLSRVTGRLP